MKRFSSLLMALIAVLAIVAIPLRVHAASNSLGVNPRRDYTIKPGETVQDVLSVSNLNKTEPLTIAIRILDFEAKDQTGAPELQLTRKEPTRWSLKPYIKIATSQTIPAGKSVEIPVSITMPATIGAGSYYSAIHYAVSAGEDSGNVSLASSSVSLLFVRVPGEARSVLKLEQLGAFTPSQDFTSGAYGSFFSAAKPKYVSYSLKNLGNIAEQPTGSMELTNMFGKTVKVYDEINPNKNLVLIDQTRRIDLCLNEVEVTKKNKLTGNPEEVKECQELNLTPGRYKTKISVMYGTNGTPSQEIRETAAFWYLPAWFLIAVAVGLLMVAAFVRSSVHKLQDRGRKTYSRR